MLTNSTDKEIQHARASHITWFILAGLCVLFGCILYHFILFPEKYTIPMICILTGIAVIMAFFSFRLPKKTAVSVINIILSAALASGSLYIPSLEKSLKGVFQEQTETADVIIHIYALKTNTDDTCSSILTQTSVDQDNQEKCLEAFQKEEDNTSLEVIEKDTVWDELHAFFSGEGDLMILNEAYLPTIEEQDAYKDFTEQTKVIYTFTGKEELNTDQISDSLTKAPFTLYIAGSDTREDELTTVTRTDVNILLTVDPINKTILELGIPRDAYIPNPAYDNALDKLTHLGASGIDNTLTGVSDYFGIPVSSYMMVNFSTYSAIIDALDGIDIDNPYEFTTIGGNGGGDYTFPAGKIHLDGDMALSYVRERYNLINGDMGRSEHQLIVLKGIINKITSAEILSHINDVLDALQGKFLTNLSTDDIYGLVQQELNTDTSWTVVQYHLDERSDRQETASMPGQSLYVGWLYDNQAAFVKEQMNAVLNQETITQQELPAGR